jgi:hypothetical protein
MKYFLDNIKNTQAKACATFALVAQALACANAFAAPALMPLPAHMSSGKGKLTIDSSFSVRASGHSDRRLEAAIAR